MRYIIFDSQGFIGGSYIDEVTPINIDSDFVLVTDELALELASKQYKAVKKIGALDKGKVYDILEEIVAPYKDTEVIVVDEIIDSEKLAIAEAIADLYKRMMLLEGGESSGSNSY